MNCQAVTGVDGINDISQFIKKNNNTYPDLISGLGLKAYLGLVLEFK